MIADGSDGDQQCGGSGENKSPWTDACSVYEIMKPIGHEEIGERPGNEIGNDNFRQKFADEHKDDVFDRCPLNFPDSYFLRFL